MTSVPDVPIRKIINIPITDIIFTNTNNKGRRGRDYYKHIIIASIVVV